MSENLSGTPDVIVDSLSFQIGDQGFQVDGGLTDGRYTGEIKLSDGRIFLGHVEKRADGGWKVENWDSGENLESPATEIAETTLPEPQADPVVNLDSASALVSADVAVPAQELQPVAVEVPAIATMEASAPVAEEARLPAVVESISVSLPAQTERASVEGHQLIANLQQDMRGVYKPLRAARLWKQSEAVRTEITSGKGGVKAKKELMAKMDDLRDKARELHPEIEKMAQPQRSELLKKFTPLSVEGPAEAIKMANWKHREDMAVQYEQELQKWEDILNNPAGFEEYRTKAAEIESKRAAARTLFSDESDSKLLAQALARVDQRGNSQLSELRGRFPQRLLELAGLASEAGPTLEQVQKSDIDLRVAYGRAAQQLYAELMGQPQAVIQPEMPAMEPVLQVAETPMPVVEGTPEQVVETPLAEVIATPQPVAEVIETSAVPVVGEVVAPLIETPVPVAQEAVADNPAVNFGISEQELEAEKARQRAELAAAAALVAETVVPAVKTGTTDGDVLKGMGQFTGGFGVSIEAKAQEYAGRISAGEDPKAMGVPDALRTRANELVQNRAVAPEALSEPPKPEAVVETSDERLDRRKKGFAQAVAEFDLAKDNRTGTEEERLVQLAESFNEIIGAGIELMQEGDEAKEVVRAFLEKALNNPSGRKLTEVSVKSRLEDAGALPLLGMTPEDRKKKLEEAGLMGFLELLIELGMSFADKTIEAIVGEVQSATGSRG